MIFIFDKNIFASRLQALRLSNNLNQTQLGQAIGLSKYAISKIETSQHLASIEIVYALADYFDVSIDYLVGRSDDPTPH